MDWTGTEIYPKYILLVCPLSLYSCNDSNFYTLRHVITNKKIPAVFILTLPSASLSASVRAEQG